MISSFSTFRHFNLVFWPDYFGTTQIVCKKMDICYEGEFFNTADYRGSKYP